MKKIKPILIKTGLILALIFVILLMAKNAVIRQVMESQGTKILGAKVEVGSVSLSLIGQRIRIQNLKVYNPPGFPAEVFLTVPEITVKIDTSKALKGEYHIYELTLNLKEMIVIRNKDGKLNVDQLKVVQETLAKEKEKKERKKRGEAVPEDPELDFHIELLKLNAERVIVKDYTKPELIVQVYDLGLKNKTIKNVKGVKPLIMLVMVEGLKPTAIKKAGLYAATALAGVGFLPAAAFGIIIAKDDATAELDASFGKAYAEVRKLAEELGEVKKEEKDKGLIFAKIHGCDVRFEIKKKDWNTTTVKVKARKYLLAKAQIAGGILYQLVERIK